MIYFLIFFILFPLSLVGMKEAMQINSPAYVLIFDNQLGYIKVDMTGLDCSKPLLKKLNDRKKDVKKPDPYYNHNVISLDLPNKELLRLKKILEGAHTIAYDNPLIIKFEIMPWYEKLKDAQEVEASLDRAEEYKTTPLPLPPLHDAVSSNNRSLVKYLIEKTGANPLVLDENNNSLLHESVKHYNVSLTRYLVAYCNLDPYAYNADGYMPLHIAIKSGARPTVAYFIEECGIDPSIETKYGWNCLCFALLHDKHDVIDYLIKRKVNLNMKQSAGQMPLHVAIENGNYEHSIRLVKNGADILAKDAKGIRALQYQNKTKSGDAIAKFLWRQFYKRLKREEAQCSVCLEPIKKFPKDAIAITPCCYQAVCSDNIRTLKEECPLCKKSIFTCMLLNLNGETIGSNFIERYTKFITK